MLFLKQECIKIISFPFYCYAYLFLKTYLTSNLKYLRHANRNYLQKRKTLHNVVTKQIMRLSNMNTLPDI